MIGRLTGILLEKQPPALLIDVHGVGYELEASMSTFYSLPECGEAVTLHTHLVVREDAQLLYGFFSSAERLMFRTLIKISGVGPKLALSVLGAMSGEKLAQVIRAGDAKRLSAIPGIGKKTAERVILELGGKLLLGKDDTTTQKNQTFDQLASALKNLGFKSAQVEKILARLEKENAALPFEDLLRLALSWLQEK